MRDNDQAVVHGSEFPDWLTPHALRAALDAEFDFDVDLAANAENHLAESWLGPGSNLGEEDALKCSWNALAGERDDGKLEGLLVGFLNPPFSRELKMPIEPWIKKCVAEQAAGFTTVAVLPHRPDTKWWRLTMHATEIREIPHRIPFLLPAEVFRARNKLRAALGKKHLRGTFSRTPGGTVVVQTGGAGFPSAIVVFRPQPGIIGPALPRRVLWDYLNRTKRPA